jgi:hypothetical protein
MIDMCNVVVTVDGTNMIEIKGMVDAVKRTMLT